MLQVYPNERPTMKSIIRFPLFKDDTSFTFNFFNHNHSFLGHNIKQSDSLYEEKTEKEANRAFENEYITKYNSTSNVDEEKINNYNVFVPLSLNCVLKSRKPIRNKCIEMNRHKLKMLSFKTVSLICQRDKKLMKYKFKQH